MSDERRMSEHRREIDRRPVCCHDCGLAYGSEGWVDACVSNTVWQRISPTGDEGGILCFTCMARRCVRLGLQGVVITLRSGPFVDPNLARAEGEAWQHGYRAGCDDPALRGMGWSRR